jgi:integrase
MPVGDIEPQHVTACLNPIWMTKKETARRVMQRINVVMRWAKAMKYRAGDNPAAWEGNLEFILPKQGQEVSHHLALAFEDLPSFWTELSAIQTVSADALRFLILTAARIGEVRGATWDEINLEKALQELEEHGFIKRVRRGYFTSRKASEYALTDERLNGHAPTNEWRLWRSPKPHRRRQIRTVGTQTILMDMRYE